MQRNEEAKKSMFTFYSAVPRLRSKLYRHSLFKERDCVNFSLEGENIQYDVRKRSGRKTRPSREQPRAASAATAVQINVSPAYRLLIYGPTYDR
jgi:hypothetical protein